MGGCASKNKKQPKEEPYKPADAPKDKAVVEEVIGEEKQAATNKAPSKQNGSASEFRNSLVGPGGVILPNQPGGKDEADPSIPFIDAIEDEAERQAKAAAAKASKAGETIKAEVVTNVEAVSAEVTAGAENAAASVKAGVQEVGEKAAAATEAVTDKVTEVKSSASEEASNGDSLMKAVFKDIKPELPVCEGPVNTEEIKLKIEEKVEDASASVKEAAQSGLDSAKSAASDAKEAAQPVIDGIQNFSIGETIAKVINGDDSGEDFAGFRMLESTQEEIAATDDAVSQLNQSVGFIYSQHDTGIGFRVGDKYIMTSYHLVKSITDKMPSSENPEEQLLHNKDVWIQFEYLQMGEYEFDNPTRFKFANISYSNPGLDVVIIELELENKTMPPPIVSFSEVGNSKVEFLDHETNPQKRKTPATQICQPTEEELQKASSWCKSRGFAEDTYSGLKEPNRVRFQQLFEHGNSGCPGVVVKGEELSVTVMITRSYPGFFQELDEDQQEKVPVGLQLDEVVSLPSVFKDMKNQDKLSELCNNIFGQTNGLES